VAAHASDGVELDGGYGWVVVGAAFASMACVFGVAYSYGAFFDAIAHDLGTGKGATSLPYAITTALFFVLGVFTGPLGDRFGPRRVVLAGALTMTAGLLLTAAVRSLWVDYVTYGLGVGVGVACGYVPMVAAVSAWFPRRRGIATGIAVSGIGVGTIVTPIVAAALIGSIGWRWAYVALALTTFAVLLVAAMLVATPPAHAAVPLRLSPAVRTRVFARLYVSGLLMSFPLAITFVYLAPFAEDHHSSRFAASALVSLVGAGSVVGRLGLGWYADRRDRVATFRACLLLMAAACALWFAASAYAALAVFALLFGVAYGGWVALSPAVAADLFGAAALGGSIGALYTSGAVGSLAAPPLAGFVIDATHTYRWVLGAAVVLAGVAFAWLLPVRPAARRESADHRGADPPLI
jgi:MFS family permease